MPEETAPSAPRNRKINSARCHHRRRLAGTKGSPSHCAGGSTTCARAASCCSRSFATEPGSIQGVAHVKSVPPEVFEALKGLTQESSVIVTGKVRADKRAPGGYELDVEDVEVVQRVPESDPYPITLKEHGVDFLHGAAAPVGAVARASRRFCAFARRSCARRRNTSTRTDLSGPIRRF